jgi:integrase
MTLQTKIEEPKEPNISRWWWGQKSTERKTLTLTVTHGKLGRKLRDCISANVPEPRNETEKIVNQYLIDAISEHTPKNLPLALENNSIRELARYLLRSKSGSTGTIDRYVRAIASFSKFSGKTPDQIIMECINEDGLPNARKLSIYSSLLDDLAANLQMKGLAPQTVLMQAKAVKTWFTRNGLPFTYVQSFSNRTIYEDRAPKPEELAAMINIADIRGKTIISMLGLGGFRLGTLCSLRYRHVMEDLEKNVVPVHVHVESEITKGKYHSYDTFLGAEAVEYLHIYVDMRRKGLLSPRYPPEDIQPESPLIRNAKMHLTKAENLGPPKPMQPGRMYYVIHDLYRKTGLPNYKNHTRYTLRAHSIRKYFRTQLSALGVERDYIEYMMGHTISTYHDIEMKGIEFLRNIYAASGLSIRPKTAISKIDALKEIIRAWGMNPEEILTRKAFSEPHATYASGEHEEQTIKELSNALKEMMRKELFDGSRKDGN